MSRRKLVSIRTITDVKPIPDADRIEVATVDHGWKVVVRKGEFEIGSQAVYFEIDSWIPSSLYEFNNTTPKLYEGILGNRLRTVKLRKQVSQGLILPIDSLPAVAEFVANASGDITDADLSELLGVVKYEPPAALSLGGEPAGNFPFFISKTDQERAQTLYNELFVDRPNATYEVTMKLDGSSFTGYYFAQPGEEPAIGCCSRNLEYKINDTNLTNNAFISEFVNTNLNTALEKLGRNIAVQAELMGPKIQGNREGFPHQTIFVFDIWDIDNQVYFKSYERYEILDKLREYGFNAQHVPILHKNFIFNFKTMDELIAFADGPSVNHKYREGLVFKQLDDDFSFKVISNQFLLKSEL